MNEHFALNLGFLVIILNRVSSINSSATDKAYASKLIGIIELYNLNHYDKEALKKKEKKNFVEAPHTPYTSWELLYIEARQGDTFNSIGKEFGIKPRKLAKYNDLPKDAVLTDGMVIYLEEKTYIILKKKK